MNAYFELDPNIALVKLRIEIEKRVRKLYLLSESENSNKYTSISKQINKLEKLNKLEKKFSEGLIELIKYSNMAAHGAKVDNKISFWAKDKGTEIINNLDKIIDSEEVINNYEHLKFSLKIIKFKRVDGIDIAKFVLNEANNLKQGTKIILASGGSPKYEIAELLTKLGALTSNTQRVGKATFVFKITKFGQILLKELNKNAL